MKKTKVLSFVCLSMAAAMLASCGHEHTFASEWSTDATSHWHAATCEHHGEKADLGNHEYGDDNICDICGYQNVTPVPINHEVTKDEWNAAFGTSKIFFIADNYKCSVTLHADGRGTTAEIAEVDGNKLHLSALADGSMLEEMYYEAKSRNLFDQYEQENQEWEVSQTSENPMLDFAKHFSPFVYDNFTYDSEAHTYECASGTDEEFGAITNLEIAFSDKKISLASFDLMVPISESQKIPATMTFSFEYGGQAVTLPHVEPVVGKATYGYSYNASAYVSMQSSGKGEQWELLDFTVAEGDTLQFANIVNPTAPAQITNLIDNGNLQGFTNIGGVLTAGVEGCYSFFLNIIEEEAYITISQSVPPTPVADVRLMGYEDDWDGGILMVPTYEGSKEYIAEHLALDVGDKLKVKFEQDWISTYKNGGKKNAIDDHLAEIDMDLNVQFNYGGVYNVYFNSDTEGGQYGVFVEWVSVNCPYVGYADFSAPSIEIHQSASFEFNKIDLGQNFIEYKLINCGATNGMKYTVKNGENLIDFVLEKTGEGANFEEVNSEIIYTGSCEALSFYLKEDLTEHTYKVYVEEYVEEKPVPETVKVTLSVVKDAGMGNGVYILGTINSWDISQAIRGTWTEGNVWVFEITIPTNTVVEYKFCLANYQDATQGSTIWEGGSNRVLNETQDASYSLTWQD